MKYLKRQRKINNFAKVRKLAEFIIISRSVKRRKNVESRVKIPAQCTFVAASDSSEAGPWRLVLMKKLIRKLKR